MRQGCPLSPLIFAMMIESLAIAIWGNPDIKHVHFGQSIHKCALFADDLLLFVTSPTSSIQAICALLKEFAVISGLHVNMSKSQALNVSLPSSLISLLQYQFEWSHTSIKYLGLNITAKIKNLYQANYPPRYQKLEADLRSWESHEISWMGRINLYGTRKVLIWLTAIFLISHLGGMGLNSHLTFYYVPK